MSRKSEHRCRGKFRISASHKSQILKMKRRKVINNTKGSGRKTKMRDICAAWIVRITDLGW